MKFVKYAITIALSLSMTLFCLPELSAQPERPGGSKSTKSPATQSSTKSESGFNLNSMFANKKNYRDIYLTASEVGPGFSVKEDHIEGPLQDNPAAFQKYGGQRSGLQVFTTKNFDEVLNRVVDLRWTFPDAQSAQAFLRESVAKLAENMPQVRNAPTVGDSSLLVGGENEMLKVMTGESGINNFAYLFVSGRVVGKVYGSQGSQVKNSLTADMLLPIAKRAALRCKNF